MHSFRQRVPVLAPVLHESERSRLELSQQALHAARAGRSLAQRTGQLLLQIACAQQQMNRACRQRPSDVSPCPTDAEHWLHCLQPAHSAACPVRCSSRSSYSSGRIPAAPWFQKPRRVFHLGPLPPRAPLVAGSSTSPPPAKPDPFLHAETPHFAPCHHAVHSAPPRTTQ